MASPSTEHIIEQLFREFFTPLAVFAAKYTGDLDEAKDIVHQVFHNLWEKQKEIDWDRSMKSYLYSSVQNRSLNYIRDRKKFTGQEGQQDQEHSDFRDTTVEDQLVSSEEYREILNAMADLPGRCREVFELSRFEELKYHEIAERLNISVKTVETQMSKALKILREKLRHMIELILWALLWINL